VTTSRRPAKRVIRIGHYRCALQPFSRGAAAELSRNGDYDASTKAIRIDASISAAHQGEILLHEMIHGLFDAYGWEEPLTEEQCCQKLGKALAATFQTNPWLHDVLRDALSGKKGVV